jgi:hypothetical protein
VSPLLADIWTRRGLSLLWGAPALTKAAPQEIVSLRKLFVLAEEGFHDPLPSNGGKLLIATGLEGALDALSPDDAEAWTIDRIRPVLEHFQEAWQGDGALAFWLPSGEARIVSRPVSAAYDWHLPTGHGGRTLPLSQLIFAGAADGLQQIMDDSAGPAIAWIGLYHPRIS